MTDKLATEYRAGLMGAEDKRKLTEHGEAIKANFDAIANQKPTQFEGLSTNTSLVAGGAYRLLAHTLTLTLPPAPTPGDTIRIMDGEVLSADNTVTISRNGNTIMALAEDLILDLAGLEFLIWWDGADWRLF